MMAAPAAPAAPAEGPCAEDMWGFMAKKIGPHKLGPRPRKMNAEYIGLISDVIVSLSACYDNKNNLTVTPSCLNILQTALKFYYVVPSAERFRDFTLIENLCSGQRLNYAFDFMHFDTGQLSQVVYLHNLQFKQTVPPNSISDWQDSSCAGPISAFLQLITDLEIWLHDSDDPLGILGDVQQIRRPLDHNKEASDTTQDGANDAETQNNPLQSQYNPSWGIIINKTDAYLVDRANLQLYNTPQKRPLSEFHRVMPLLVIYLRKNNLMESIACVALNALKISASL